MNDVDARLLRCFRVVFPNVAETDLRTASQDSIETWDSVATITLPNVIEDEFHRPVDFERLDELTSFDRFREYLAEKATPEMDAP